MRKLDELEVGLMFWGEHKPGKSLEVLESLGVRCGHLGFAGHVALDNVPGEWKEELQKKEFVVTSIWSAFEGESYADIPTVQRTVGFIPPEFREQRERRAREVIDTGASLGIKAFACHIGFVPEDHHNAAFIAVRDIVRRICDYARERGMIFALETGQERAETMLKFLEETSRENLKINFDPANIILYGTEEPLPSLKAMAPHVVSVHCKDGNWPDPQKPGSLGQEMPLGEGAVGMEQFVATLKEIGYTAPLVIEREVSLEQDMDDRHKEGVSHLDDIRAAIALLKRLR